MCFEVLLVEKGRMREEERERERERESKERLIKVLMKSRPIVSEVIFKLEDKVLKGKTRWKVIKENKRFINRFKSLTFLRLVQLTTHN